jgi:hypothetical protein
MSASLQDIRAKTGAKTLVFNDGRLALAFCLLRFVAMDKKKEHSLN